MTDQEKSLWQKIKGWVSAAATLAAVVAGYIFFFYKQKPEGLPERPTKFPGGDERPEIPEAPKVVDWAGKIAETEKKIREKEEKLDTDAKLADDINKRYPQ